MDHEQHPLMTSFLSQSSDEKPTSEQNLDSPNYWAASPSTLVTTSNLHSLRLGTGNRIIESFLSSIESAEHEVVFVTCYWASSTSLSRICDSLRRLSAKALASNRKIRVRICFSSSGVWQKLFHTQSPQGKVYDPSSWTKDLGLPAPDELQGLDLEVKSIFLLPISIIHPKFIVVDRKIAFLPSCNVSWENWFEGCLELSGPVVGQFLRFWQAFWTNEDTAVPCVSGSPNDALQHKSTASNELLSKREFESIPLQTLFLPSPHHRNPRFRLPWQAPPPAPLTPLNIFLLQALQGATKYIYIQTPNLTSQPVISALLSALDRGVNVSILTSERLQLLEQIITAGTTSPRCVAKLIAQHRAMVEAQDSAAYRDVEAMAAAKLGTLKVSYYQPQAGREASDDEPVQSHFKLTVVDGEVAVFGSGNMDRPSWYTSQELGVAFFSTEFVAEVERSLAEALTGRCKLTYEG